MDVIARRLLKEMDVVGSFRWRLADAMGSEMDLAICDYYIVQLMHTIGLEHLSLQPSRCPFMVKTVDFRSRM